MLFPTYFLKKNAAERIKSLHLGTPFFPGAPELWHHPLAAYSAAAELPGAALQHATLVHPALHPQVPISVEEFSLTQLLCLLVSAVWYCLRFSYIIQYNSTIIKYYQVSWQLLAACFSGRDRLKPQMSIPHPAAALTSIHASLPHFLPSPALASPVGSSSSQPGIGVNNAPCSTLFVANLGQFVSEHELKEIFSRYVANVVVGELDSTGKPQLVVSKMLEATNSSTIAIVFRDALLQTFDEEQAVGITEANATISCSSVCADLAYVKSNFGNLLVTIAEERDLPLVKAVKIRRGIEENLNQASGSVGTAIVNKFNRVLQ
uniref:RRM domain-containing protein n=1 Tax=Timema monikensis TaxID=170555 RepID=A0A7R9HJX6_9NEOP|nr:unnamed protein product [Timema monikensis]